MIETRQLLFRTLIQIIQDLISQRIGDIRKPGQQFNLEISYADIQPHIDPEVFKVFEEDSFVGLSALIQYFEKTGVIEDMSGPSPSILSIRYTSSEEEVTNREITGRPYKRTGSLLS